MPAFRWGDPAHAITRLDRPVMGDHHVGDQVTDDDQPSHAGTEKPSGAGAGVPAAAICAASAAYVAAGDPGRPGPDRAPG
jgi:hypothetical protein